jgi:hypothetical protein
MGDVFRSLRFLLEAAAPVDEDEHRRWTRRVYNWVQAKRVLPTEPAEARGEGRSRRYHRKFLPVLATLLVFSDKVNSIEITHAVSVALRSRLRNDARFATQWAEVFEAGESKAAKRSATTYLTVAFPSPADKRSYVPRIDVCPKADRGTDIDGYFLDISYVAWKLADVRPGLEARPLRRRRS